MTNWRWRWRPARCWPSPRRNAPHSTASVQAASIWSATRFPQRRRHRPAEHRREILFVGAFHELSPNEDAARWFLTEVLPTLRERFGDTVKVTIVGPDPPQAVARFAGPGIDVPGPVPDLRPVYDRARIFIAPTRFAAGIPLKVVDAAAHGVPAVVTPLLASQLAWTPGEDLLVGDGPQAFAESCIRLFEDAALWARIRHAALARIERDYAPQVFTARLGAALDRVTARAEVSPR